MVMMKYISQRASWLDLGSESNVSLMPSNPGINDSSKMSIINSVMHAFAPGEDNLLLAQGWGPKDQNWEIPVRDDDSELTRTIPEGQDTGFQLVVWSIPFSGLKRLTLWFYRWFLLGWV